jgi:hypothetical protein
MPKADRPAATDADFYLLEQMLEPEGRELLHRVREFMEKSVVGRAITGLSAFV